VKSDQKISSIGVNFTIETRSPELDKGLGLVRSEVYGILNSFRDAKGIFKRFKEELRMIHGVMDAYPDQLYVRHEACNK
jgi:hypothetical protein